MESEQEQEKWTRKTVVCAFNVNVATVDVFFFIPINTIFDTAVLVVFVFMRRLFIGPQQIEWGKTNARTIPSSPFLYGRKVLQNNRKHIDETNTLHYGIFYLVANGHINNNLCTPLAIYCAECASHFAQTHTHTQTPSIFNRATVAINCNCEATTRKIRKCVTKIIIKLWTCGGF